MSDVRHVVLIHGAWHGGWCFSALQSELDRRGVPSYAVDLPGHGASTDPLGTFDDDVSAVRKVLHTMTERGLPAPVLVGHSYGGAVISAASGDGTPVSSLIYLAAFALYAGESVLSAMSSFPKHDVALGAAIRVGEDGTSILDAAAARSALYGSCDDRSIDAAISRLSPQPMATMTRAVTTSGLGALPSLYVVCSQDRAVHPAHQKIMATRCSRAITLDTDHSPFLSMVSETADIIESDARR